MRASLIGGSAGTLYGTTQNGGSAGFGTVFEVKADGSETVLYSFKGRNDGGTPLDVYSFTGGNDGGRPQAGLIMDSKGDLFGTTVLGGASGLGTVFELAADGKEIVLHSFSGGSDGATPVARLKMTSAGNLYGTTIYGGGSTNCVGGCGTVFEIRPSTATQSLSKGY